MEKLARKLAADVSLALGYDAEKEAVVAYGLIAIIQITITTLLILIFGILIGAPVEAMILCFSVSIFRKYSGGAHARTAEICTCFSVFYCVAMAVVSKKLLAGICPPVLLGPAVILVYLCAFLIVGRVAPVDSPNKPIRTEKKRKRMRKYSFVILSAYLTVSIVFLIFSGRSEILRSWAISLLLGVAWQTFTLTYSGSQFIAKMNGIFLRRKEVNPS